MWLKIILFALVTSGVTSSFELGGVMSGNSMAGVPLGRSLGNGELDVEGICKESGVACQNCSQAVTCVSLPVGWLKVPLEGCQKGKTCNAQKGGCSDNPVPECDVQNQKHQHVCEQVGIFPDPYDCRKFHLCSPPEGIPDGRPADHRIAMCPKHYGYNPLTAQCSIQLKYGQCSKKPVPDCTAVGQSGALPASPNHYYVCLLKKGLLYPQIFICPHGWFFWDGFCHQKSNTGNKVDDSSSEEETASTTTSTTTEKPTTTKTEVFFSTDKPVTYAADTFLADRFDLTNYESTDDYEAPRDDFAVSFESENSWW